MDLSRLRADTPATRDIVHLNNAGSALMPTPVVQALHEHIDLEARLGGYEAADAAAEAIQDAYQSVADVLKTGSHNIAIMENATTAFNTALSSFAFEAGDVILTTRNDYVSNQIAFLALAQRFGVEVVRAPEAPEGGVDVAAAAAIMHRRRPRLVTASHMPTNSGLIQPVAELGRACRASGVPFLLDACQTVGQLDLDLSALSFDFLSATARKFLRGPRGIGFLVVSDEALASGYEPLFPDLRGADWIDADLYQPAPDARRYENWEFAYALVLGLGAAARYAAELGMDTIETEVRNRAASLRAGLSTIDGARVLDRGSDVGGIVTVAFEGHEPAPLRDGLRARGIHTSYLDVGSAVLDFQDKQVAGALRLSPHYYNTEAELTTAVEALREIASA